MTVLRQIIAALSRWMDCVAATVISLLGGLGTRRTVRLIEQVDGSLAFEPAAGAPPLKLANGAASAAAAARKLLSGSHVELALRPDRFFFRPLELPRRAGEFLDGIVRAQIDRITPWTASEAVFGWGAPADIANDRISVTIAATPRAQVVPFGEALHGLGAKSTAVFTAQPEAGADRIQVYEDAAAGSLGVNQVRRVLAACLLVMAVLAGIAMTADAVVGSQLRSRQDDVARRIAERRGIIRAGNSAAENSDLAKLMRRKSQIPATVMVLEALSSAIPDSTYATELRVEGDRVQIVGFSNDAPSLIRLIEQSPYFTRATFFAPTTRSPSDPGDRFHIEARIKPQAVPPS